MDRPTISNTKHLWAGGDEKTDGFIVVRGRCGDGWFCIFVSWLPNEKAEYTSLVYKTLDESDALRAMGFWQKKAKRARGAYSSLKGHLGPLIEYFYQKRSE
tara:strand:- start:461 stop:763 length:303 start_codon:yes stop_codon:yes gene_type:complete